MKHNMKQIGIDKKIMLYNMNMNKQPKKSDQEHEDNLFVFQKSLEAQQDTLNSIRKSIENERSKAGILLGFFFLVTIEGLPYFEKLPMFLKGTCFVLIVLILILLIRAFCSKKMKDGVLVDENFKRDWNNQKAKFLTFHHEILRESIESQKTELTANSKRTKYSAILLGAILIILFLNFNLPMFNKIFGDEESSQPITENTMKSEVIELSENDDNPMKPESVEKGAEKE